MKILFICNEYPPNKHGGIGTFTKDLAEVLATNGHEVTVWGCYENQASEVCEVINGVKVIRIPYRKSKSRFNHLKFIIKLNFQLRIFLNKAPEFDIIECQEWQGLLPLGLKHKGYVVRLHGASIFFDTLLNRPGNRMMHFFEKLTIKNAPNLVAVSKYCGDVTLNQIHSNQEFTTIYNCVDSEKIENALSQESKNYQNKKIVFANSMLPKKGVFELADAFNLIANKFPEATLTYIGKTGYEENGINIKDLVLNRVKQEFKDRVFILGWLPSIEDVFKHLATAEVCVYPSHMEGFGIAPLEGMASKRPTIFMKNGPGPEVIEDNVSGLLADTKDPKDIAAKIEFVFENPEMAKEYSINAKQRIAMMFEKNTVFYQKNIDYYKRVS